MNQNPLVSIVIPTYNRAADLNRALVSIINQTYSNWEVLLVDNHSTDNTDEIVAAFNNPRIKKFKILNGGIIAKSRNLGIKEANGEYIAFLDSDDWWAPEKLQCSVLALDKGADIVYHDLWLAKADNKFCFFRRAKTRTLQVPVLLDLLKNGNAVTNSSVVVRKSIVEKVGYLSEDIDFLAWEDFDYWIRISKLTNKFYRLNKCLGYYWIGGGNLSNQERTIRIFKKILEKYDFLFKEYELVSEGQKPWWIEYYEIKNSNISFLSFVKKWMKQFIYTMPLEFQIKLIIRFFFSKLFS
ncbi:glycosyltransferase family 2 protein [Leptospira kanakyensis]|uniref:glycosyltransferase family 2 protein n=1 Tax=Leptospira kanakyensis TaxID=2484968 RepID=UPI00223E41BC|nr:glycosyltransferase [Leptospira kanakyensis]MCW7471383.1 glycosyltransferase [Leptospira kanakyensis]